MIGELISSPAPRGRTLPLHSLWVREVTLYHRIEMRWPKEEINDDGPENGVKREERRGAGTAVTVPL
ncbi:MAG: hypothetical protein LUQ62_02865 [Methanomicrobiales archaeon]|nr:hypothetical protein [Methanomicrobiales archaeon]